MSPSGPLLLLCLHLAVAATPWHNATREAETLQERGRLAEAESILLDALRPAAALPPNAIAYIHNGLGSIYQDQRRFENANRHYRLSIDAWERAGAAHRLALAKTLNNQASLLWDHHRLAEAERLLVRSANIQLEILGPSLPQAAELHYNLAAMHWNKGRWSEAETAYLLFLNREDSLQQEPLKAAVAAVNLAILARKSKDEQKAATFLQRATRIWEQHRTAPQISPMLLIDLSSSFSAANLLSHAEAAGKQALASVELRYGASHTRTAQVLTQYAAVLRKLNRKAEAKTLEARARQIEAADPSARLSNQTIDISAFR